MREESPTRPGALERVPPVEVPAAMWPWMSSATAPTVSWEWAVGRELAVAAEGGVGSAGGFALLELHEAVAFAVDDELGVVDQSHAVLGGETLGTRADEVDMRRFFEHQAGGLDGVAEALDAGDAAGAEVGAVHEQGVELDAAVAGEEGAAAGVEGVVVFHDGDGGFDGVDGCAAVLELCPAGGQGGGDAALVRVDGVVGHGPGATVDEEDGVRHLFPLVRQDSVPGLCGGQAVGRVKQNFEPWPSSLSTQMRPPWASVSRRAMARPRPVPPLSRERALSTR